MIQNIYYYHWFTIFGYLAPQDRTRAFVALLSSCRQLRELFMSREVSASREQQTLGDLMTFTLKKSVDTRCFAVIGSAAWHDYCERSSSKTAQQWLRDKQLHYVRNIVLSNRDMVAGKTLYNVLLKLPKIRSLRLSGCKYMQNLSIEQSQRASVTSLLTKDSFLQNLEIDSMLDAEGEISKLMAAIGASNQLRSLSIRRLACNVGSSLLNDMMRTLQDCTSLKSFSFKDTIMNSEAFLKSIVANDGIEQLDFTGVGFPTDNKHDALCKVIRRRSKHLDSLILTRSNVLADIEGFEALVDVMCDGAGLRSLDLSFTNAFCSARAVRALTRLLRSNKDLIELNIVGMIPSDWKKHESAYIELYEAVASSRWLQTVSLGGLHAGVDLVKHFLDRLCGNTSIKQIRIQWKDFAEEQVDLVTSLLQKNAALQKLHLVCDGLTKDESSSTLKEIACKSSKTIVIESDETKQDRLPKAIKMKRVLMLV